jgi:hypothetical protein
MTPSGLPFLNRLLGQSRDGHPQGVEWLWQGGAWDKLSKINPIFDTFCGTVGKVDCLLGGRRKREKGKELYDLTSRLKMTSRRVINSIGVLLGVSKRVKDGCRPPALRAGYP